MIRIGCLVLMMALPGVGVAMAAPPLPAADSPYRIESVTHDAGTPLPPGGRVTVRLRGPRGGMAHFHIAGVVADVGMREVASPRGGQNSLYIGTYVVQPGNAARAAAVLATLRVGNQELFQFSDRPVTMDARPPQVVGHRPHPQERLQNLQPNIVIGYHDGETSVDPARVKLFVNGEDVTRRAAITETFAVYTPQSPFRPGPVRVRSVVGDRAGNTVGVEWGFEVASPNGLIRSVTLNPATGLRSGDNLTIVMMGAPAGRASFAVNNGPQRLPMNESARTRGLYVGSYPVRSGDRADRLSIHVRLQKGTVASTAVAVATVPIFGPPTRPTITTAAVVPGSRGVERIVVRGRARPADRVRAVLSDRVTTPLRHPWKRLVEVSALARPDGTWQVSFGPVVPWPHAALFLTAVVIDPLGQRSGPATVELARSPGEPEEASPAIVPDEPEVVLANQPPAEIQAQASPLPATVGPVRCPAGHVYLQTGYCAAAVAASDPERKTLPPSPPAAPQDDEREKGKGKGRGGGKGGK